MTEVDYAGYKALAFTRHAKRVRRRREAEREGAADPLAARRTFNEMAFALTWGATLNPARWSRAELFRARRAELLFGKHVTIETRETADHCGACGRRWRWARPIWGGRGHLVLWCSCGRIRRAEGDA